jgi:bla regulator protein blaR1
MIATLLCNAVLVAALAPLVACLSALIRRPAVAHWLWLAVLVKFFMPAIVVVPLSVDLFSWWIGPSGQPTHLGAACFLIWILGSSIVTLRLLRRAELFRQLVARRGDIHDPGGDLAKEVDAGGPWFPTPQVLLVEAVHSPMLCGIAHASWILFPKDLWFALSTDARKTLLAHELAHFRRGDGGIRFFEFLATAVFWWHPMLWWTKRGLELCGEDCCDAIAAADNPREYAQAMLVTLDFLCEPSAFRPLASSCLLQNGNDLQRRMKRILDQSVDVSIPIAHKIFVAIFYLLVCTVSLSLQ